MPGTDPDDPASRSPRSRLIPIFWLIGGVALGLILAKGLMGGGAVRGEETSLPADQNRLSQRTPLSEPDVPPDLPAKKDPPAEDTNAKPEEAKEGDGTKKVDDPPPSLTGTVPSGPIPSAIRPVNPVVLGAESELAAAASFVEIMVIIPEADCLSTVQKVLSLFRSAGAELHLDLVHDSDRPELGRDFIIAVPKDGASRLGSELLKVGSAQETDRWSGPSAERRHRVERPFREAIQHLETRLRQLLVKYLDDAPEVVRTREALDHYRKGLSALKPIPQGKAALRVFVGKAPPVS